MRRISLLWPCLSLLLPAWAQVLPANEIKDPELRALQERNLYDLKNLGAEILAPLPPTILSSAASSDHARIHIVLRVAALSRSNRPFSNVEREKQKPPKRTVHN
jgi:hypothetical protein